MGRRNKGAQGISQVRKLLWVLVGTAVQAAYARRSVSCSLQGFSRSVHGYGIATGWLLCLSVGRYENKEFG